MMSEGKVRVGFIGTGGIANAHLRGLSQMSDVELVAFCDVDMARAGNAATTYQGKPYTDYRRMLDNEKLEAVYVCVPPHAHVGQEEELVARGIPLFVEKPISNSLEQARSIGEKVAATNLITSVGYHWR